MKKDARKKDFEIRLDLKSAVPVYEQIKRGIKYLIISGYLKEGDQLLSIRELASKLRVNPNTIVKVYYQLEAEGFIASRPGSMYFVKLDREKVKREREEIFKREVEEFVSRMINMGYSPVEIIREIEITIKNKGGKG